MQYIVKIGEGDDTKCISGFVSLDDRPTGEPLWYMFRSIKLKGLGLIIYFKLSV